MKPSFCICFFTVLFSQYSCQVTHLYGTVRPRPTGLLGYVTLEPTAATTASSVDRESTTGLYSAYNYENTNNRDQYDNRGSSWETYQTTQGRSAWDTYQTTQAPADYDDYARRYSSSSSGQNPSQGSSSYSSASGQGVRVGGSASSSSSSQSGQPSYGSSSSYSSASRGYAQPSQPAAYDSRYGQQAPQQPAYDGRYAYGQQSPPAAYDSRYSQPSQSGRYDQYGSPQAQDSRYDQYGRPVDPRYNVAYRQPAAPAAVDYSLYPPTLKSIVLSESSVYLFWVDPAQQGKKDAENSTKYVIKYNSLRPTADGRQEEQQTEVSGKSHQINHLQPGADYSFSIKANRNGQETGWSAPVSNRTLEAMPTGAPSNVKAEPTDRDATVKISPPEGFSGNIRSYLVLYAPSGGGQEPRVWSEQTIPAAYSGETTFVLRNLKPAEEYFYTIQATNSRGSSPFTEIASFKTLGYPNYGTGSSYAYNTPAPAPSQPYGGDAYPGYNPGYDSRYGQDQYGRPAVEATTEDYWSRYRTEQPRASENTPDQWGNYPEEYPTTTDDYWSRYPTAAVVDDRNYDSRYQTPYPGYESNTPDYYGRYAGQQTTQDYWAARYPATTPPSHEDHYGQTGLIGTVTAAPQTTDIYWSPYWGAATEPSRAVTSAPWGSSAGGSAWSGNTGGSNSAGGSAWSGSSNAAGSRHSATPGGPDPPTDVRVDSLEDPTEALVTFTPSVSSGINNYEVYYSYDPYASDDLWQIETAPGDENQLILVRLTPGTPVHMKVRAKSARGTSEFSQVVHFQSSSGQQAETAASPAHSSDNRQEGEAPHDPYASQRGTDDHTAGDLNPDEDPTDHNDDDPDAAHTRNSRT